MVSGFIPAYRCRETIARTVQGLQKQTIPVSDIWVIDDGSDDETPDVALQAGARVAIQPHRGRGAARAKGMELGHTQLVLCCDSGLVLESTFLEKALPFFSEGTVGAVFGRIVVPQRGRPVNRWCGRHLYRQERNLTACLDASLSTGACVLRKEAVQNVGGFSQDLAFGEDRELGGRLRRNGFRVVFDPSLIAWETREFTLLGALERYWRWNNTPGSSLSRFEFLRLVWYSVRVMALKDILRTDMFGALISLLVPWYWWIKSWNMSVPSRGIGNWRSLLGKTL